MEQLEAKAEEHTKGMELRCKGWCHDIQSNYELRCKGWCHSKEEQQLMYEVEIPDAKYFLN
jgi:hypothetical protein